MLKNAEGDFEANPVMYMNLQLRYHLGMSKQEIEEMDDYEWAETYNMLLNIRKEESKHNSPSR